jgi:hypothetical protein
LKGSGNGGGKTATRFKREPWDEGSYEEGRKTGVWHTYDKDGHLKHQKVHKAAR